MTLNYIDVDANGEPRTMTPVAARMLGQPAPENPIIDQVFDLPEYPEAQRHLEAGQGFGKVVCRI